MTEFKCLVIKKSVFINVSLQMKTSALLQKISVNINVRIHLGVISALVLQGCPYTQTDGHAKVGPFSY